jgi:TRAP-type C4-dicarboxylate transport system permease small subunit
MPDLASGARAFLRQLGRAERAIACAAFTVLVIALFLDVLVREIRGTGFSWAREVGVLGNVVLMLAGVGMASAQGAHFRPHFADRWASGRLQAAIGFLQHATTALFCLAFAGVASQAVTETYALGERLAVLRWPIWVFQLLLPLTFLLTGLRHMLMALISSVRPDQPSSAES